ncbi:MAG TPA: cytochrome P460 family protein [Patescibacteria group bacterium]|nr:cytochrome P460 family protein [Patescibacteria group bacterium]
MTVSKFANATAALVSLATFAALAFAQPAKKSYQTIERMNGYALKDYAEFWNNPDWHFVTVRFRKDTGEMRLTYANDLAWRALLAGKHDYPEGAVFGKVGLMTAEDPAFTSSAVPAGARRYQLMIRDKERGKDTEGWAYALFDGDGLAVAEDQDIASQACAACHALVPERRGVFSEPLRMDVAAKLPVTGKAPLPRVAFETVKAETLPEKIRARLPKDAAELRLVQGKLALNLFRGTIDEIRPTLAKEALRAGMPALLMSRDGTLFSVIYAAPAKTCAKGEEGLRGFYTTGVAPGKDSAISEHEYCEAR